MIGFKQYLSEISAASLRGFINDSKENHNEFSKKESDIRRKISSGTASKKDIDDHKKYRKDRYKRLEFLGKEKLASKK